MLTASRLVPERPPWVGDAIGQAWNNSLNAITTLYIFLIFIFCIIFHLSFYSNCFSLFLCIYQFVNLEESKVLDEVADCTGIQTLSHFHFCLMMRAGRYLNHHLYPCLWHQRYFYHLSKQF